jgi:hypothetical protein
MFGIHVRHEKDRKGWLVAKITRALIKKIKSIKLLFSLPYLHISVI